MPADPASFDSLSDPQIKAYLISLLASSLPLEEKYQRLLEVLQPAGRSKDILSGLPELPPFDPDALLPASDADQLPAPASGAALDGLQRALRRLSASQHQDGGWGPFVETSTFWDTAMTVLCLAAARRQPALRGVVDEVLLLRRGCAYLEQHPEHWAADALAADGELSIYELCLMARVFFHGGREFLRRETAVRVYRSIEHLYHAQNEDGGWDANLWGYGVPAPTRVFSEVGATAAALRALAEVADERLLPATRRAVLWLMNTQNMDGSWNNGACRADLPAYTLSGDPRISKTCDAVCGLLASQAFDLSIEPYRGVVRHALAWLLRRVQPLLEKHRHPAAWAWGFTPEDYLNVNQVLETLLALPSAPRSLLAEHARWLMQGQHRADGDVEDGTWIMGHTARITLALVSYLTDLF